MDSERTRGKKPGRLVEAIPDDDGIRFLVWEDIGGIGKYGLLKLSTGKTCVRSQYVGHTEISGLKFVLSFASDQSRVCSHR